ncbi:hypothetical protein ANO14919_056800 [Xylariales sp. No.14919]|nr:hypothetical protein ANO14919_056800 [Xylariales sp. No.14919]
MASPQFAGLPGEDAEMYIMDCDTLSADKPVPEQYAATLFRGGIVSRRVKAWYNALPKETRRSWADTKAAFITEFDEDDTEEQRMLSSEVRALKRKIGEPLVDFVKRAQKLSDCVHGDLQNKLAEAFLCGMRDGEADTSLQLRLQDRLASKDLLTKTGMLASTVTFRDIRKYLGQVATPIGETNIYDERADYASMDWQVPIPPEERIAAAFEQLSKKLTESTTSSHTASSALSPVSANKGRPPGPRPLLRCFRCGNPGHGARDCTNAALPREEQNKLIEEYKEKKRHADTGYHPPDTQRATNVITMDPEMFSRVGLSDHTYDVPHMSSPMTDPAVQFVGIEKVEDLEADIAAMMAEEDGSPGASRGQKRMRSVAFPSPPSVEPLTPARPTNPTIEEAPPRVQPADTGSDPKPQSSSAKDANKTVNPTSFRQFLAKHKAELDDLRARDKGKGKISTPRDTIPARIMAEGNLPRFDVREWLAQTPITMTAAQLVDSSARIKSQFIRAMAPSTKRPGGRRRAKGDPSVVVDSVGPIGDPQRALVHVEDWGEEETELSALGYIRTYVEGQCTNRTLLDGGAVIEIISPSFVARLGLVPRPAGVPWMVRLADDKRQPVTHCVSVQVVTEGIAVVVTAYVMSAGESFDLLLSRSWLKRVRAVEHYASDVLEISGKKGVKKTVPIFPASKPKIEIELGESPKVMETQVELEQEELADVDEMWDLLFYAIDRAADMEDDELADSLKEYL